MIRNANGHINIDHYNAAELIIRTFEQKFKPVQK